MKLKIDNELKTDIYMYVLFSSMPIHHYGKSEASR